MLWILHIPSGVVMMIDLSAVHYGAVAVAVLSAFVLGAIWYSPKVFGNLWMKLMKFKADDIKGAGKTMALSFVLTLLMSLGLALVFQLAQVTTLGQAIVLTLIIGIGLIGTHSINEYLFDGYSFKVLAIHQGYRLLSLLLMGIVLGLWK